MKTIMKKSILFILSIILALGSIIPVLPVSAATKEIPITKITFPTSVNIKVGETKKLQIVTNPPNTTYKTSISWGTQTNQCFSYKVNGFGTYWKQDSSESITGTKAGTGYLTPRVKVYNSTGKYIKEYVIYTTVKVTSAATSTTSKPAASTNNKKSIPLTKITLNKTSAALTEGSTINLTVGYVPANTTSSKTVSWKSSNSNVASVSNGKVTAKKAGTATITATVNGKKATCKITVNKDGQFVNVNECYNILNQYRTKAGKKKISRNAALENYAKIRAKELVKQYSHTRPNGTKGTAIIPWSQVGKINNSLYRAENIAKGQTTCRIVMRDWYNSSGHRKNILNSNHRKVGIAGFKYKGVIYWVQLFTS